MQTIVSKYSNGKIRAKCWNGWAQVESDAALSSEANHLAAAQKLVAKLNANKLVKWDIKCSAPSVPEVRQGQDRAGWTFIIVHTPDVAPLHMSIVVRFVPSTNTQRAHMKTSSWLNPKARKVHYTNLECGSDIQGNARYAAGLELESINASCREHGDLIGYQLDQYVQLPDGDRLFTLKSK